MLVSVGLLYQPVELIHFRMSVRLTVPELVWLVRRKDMQGPAPPVPVKTL